MYPRIKFEIDCRKDFYAFDCFANDVKFDGGRNLKWAVFHKYPSLRKFFSRGYNITQRRKIEDFIINKYRKNSNVILQNMHLYEANWRKKEKQFYHLVDEIFNEKSWPKGKYIAFPTIWGMFPRFLKDKTFQIPFKHRSKRYVNVIIAHEMLHFIFYDYFYKGYPQYREEKYNMFVWHISEIFNAVIQNSPKWIAVFKKATMTYPEHNKVIRKVNRSYYNRICTTDDLLADIIHKVKNRKGIQIHIS